MPSSSASLPQQQPQPPTVERLAVRELPPRRPARPSLVAEIDETDQGTQAQIAPPPGPPPSYISHGVFKALSIIFASRLLILLALGGAFVLAVMAELSGNMLNLWVLIAYCVLTVIPLVTLDLLSRR